MEKVEYVAWYYNVWVYCPCAKFEQMGLLCKLTLYIIAEKKANTLPNRYSLDQWTIKARYQIGYMDIGASPQIQLMECSYTYTVDPLRLDIVDYFAYFAFC